MQDAGSLDISELTGDRRDILLSGRCLPYRPLSFEGSHSLESHKYPGFPTKTQQPLGAEELPTTMNGRWCDAYLGAGQADAILNDPSITTTGSVDGQTISSVDNTSITSAAVLCELIDDVRRKGQLLRVTWLHIARIGRISKFRQKWLTAHDVEWELELDWTGRDEHFTAPTPAQPEISESTRQLTKSYLDLQDSTGFDAVDDLDQRFADAIDVHVSSIQQGILDAQAAVTARVGAIAAGGDALRRAVATLQFVEDTSGLLIDQLGSTVAGSAIGLRNQLLKAPSDVRRVLDLPKTNLGFFIPDDTPPTYTTTIPAVSQVTAHAVNPSDDLRSIDFRQQASAGIAIARSCVHARRLKNAAARQRVKLLRASEANVIAVVMIRNEEDLRDLALRYYGTADDWQLIREYNALSGSQVSTGTVVLIPARKGS